MKIKVQEDREGEKAYYWAGFYNGLSIGLAVCLIGSIYFFFVLVLNR